MADFLIKSCVSMALLLAVYHLFLEKEKKHRFKRGALVFSIALPFYRAVNKEFKLPPLKDDLTAKIYVSLLSKKTGA